MQLTVKNCHDILEEIINENEKKEIEVTKSDIVSI
jgi:hypothetical protein